MKNENFKHRAKKSLGQNFLVDQNVCHKIVDAIEPGPDDNIIEIGPGQGALTRHIIEAGPKSFTVLEMDDELAERLEVNNPSINVIRTDATRFDWESLNLAPCKIIGNLPYNVGSKLIWDIVSTVTSLQHAVFMVQHEVALRLTAQPGNKSFGGLTAWVNNFARTKYLFKVPPTVFRPQPKVDSAVVSFQPLPLEEWPTNPDKLSKLIKLLFQKRRKQISTILKKHWTSEIDEWFAQEGISPSVRPENLTPAQFSRLAKYI